MNDDYPDDADGDALRRVASHADMTRPMPIEFAIAVPNEAAARLVAEIVEPLGFTVSTYYDEPTRAWSVYCSRVMVATHSAVVSVQRELDAAVQRVGAHCDGWGTFGNRKQ